MATKNLAIREDVYRMLAEVKGDSESFSDVIEKLLRRKVSLLTFSGALKESKELDEVKKEIIQARSRVAIKI